jgi:5'-nucleotidase
MPAATGLWIVNQSDAHSVRKGFGQNEGFARFYYVRLRILISNDDGIYSPGIAALAKVASKFGDVRIVAPDVEQSSMSHAITSTRPIRFKKIALGKFEAYRVNGTPADCVALGSHNWGDVDLVLSGINLGPNLGNAVWHSGTLAAAKQAALLGIRGIAFSTSVHETKEPDFMALQPYIKKVLQLLLKDKSMCLVNVNLPEKPKGIRWTRLAVGQYDGQVVPDKDPMGRPIFWFTVKPVSDEVEGTDRWALLHHWVSITPLRLDLTSEKELARALSVPEMPAITTRAGPKSNSRVGKKMRNRRLGPE